MNVIIAKNRDFETVGLKITQEGEDLFKWGVEPNPVFNYVRHLSFEKNILSIFRLVEARAELRECRRSSQGFQIFDVLKASGIQPLEGINLKIYEDRANELEQEIDAIIEKLD